MYRTAAVVAFAVSLGACATTTLAPRTGQAAPVLGDRGTDMAVDLVLVRPLSIVGTLLGTAGFVIALPFTVPSGTVKEAGREWVVEPFEYTFHRPLGDFNYYANERR